MTGDGAHVTVIDDVTLIDGESAKAQPGMRIVLSGSRIAAVERAGAPRPVDATVIDGTGMTLLPGLVDCHVHLMLRAEPDPGPAMRCGPAEMTLTALRNAYRSLQGGVTTIRDCGGSSVHAAIAVARAEREGSWLLPRVVACGQFLVKPGGHMAYAGVEVVGPEDMRRAVRDQVAAGAHWIKLVATGGLMTAGTDIHQADLSVEELRAAVETAARSGRRAAAHAIGRGGIVNAIEAGVGTIEHGCFLTDEDAELMRRTGVAHVPTLLPFHRATVDPAENSVPEHTLRKAHDVRRMNTESFRRSLAAGVRIAAGTDAGSPHNPHGFVGSEIALMIEAGAAPMTAIRFATRDGARVLGLDDEIGTVTPGKAADVIMVKGDPLTDPLLLNSPSVVIKSGRVVVEAGGSGSADPVVPLLSGPPSS